MATHYTIHVHVDPGNGKVTFLSIGSTFSTLQRYSYMHILETENTHWLAVLQYTTHTKYNPIYTQAFLSDRLKDVLFLIWTREPFWIGKFGQATYI